MPLCVIAGVVDRAGQAEIGDRDPLDAVLQQDVGRLDVAMHEPLRVGRGQPGGDLHADAQHLRHRQRPFRGRAAFAATPPRTYGITRYGSLRRSFDTL